MTMKTCRHCDIDFLRPASAPIPHDRCERCHEEITAMSESCQDKPPTPLTIQVMVYAYIASLWAYPVAPEGIGNLAAFIAWAFAGFIALGALAALVRGMPPSKYRDAPAWLRKINMVLSLGGIAWLVYNGAFLLASMALLAWGLMKLAAAVDKEQRQREGQGGLSHAER